MNCELKKKKEVYTDKKDGKEKTYTRFFLDFGGDVRIEISPRMINTADKELNQRVYTENRIKLDFLASEIK